MSGLRAHGKRSGLHALVALCAVGVLTLAVNLVSTSESSASSPITLTVAYWSQFNPAGLNIMNNWIDKAAAQLRKSHPNVRVVLEEITTSSESEYYAKLDLTERSASTAPNIVFEDSFLIGSDASAGYIRPLPQLKSWSDWADYYPAMKQMVTYDGQVYGAMNSTDTELLYYDVSAFKKAGIPVPWQPHSWADIEAAAKAIHEYDPGVIPMWLYAGQPSGEASSFRGFEVFLNGTNDRIYDDTTHKWEVSGPGFDATWNFLAAMHQYIAPESDWSSPNSDVTVDLGLMPAQKVGIVLDGSWVATAFVPHSLDPWPGFFSAYQEAELPTQSGQAPGYTTQSGGWALSEPRLGKQEALSTDLIELATSPAALASFDPATGNLPPMTSVLRQSAWIHAVDADPVLKFATDQLAYTTYRPDQPLYVQVSNELQILTGDIAAGTMTAAQAEQAYESTVTQIVGAKNVEHMIR